MNRLKAFYTKDVVAGLRKEFGYKNIMAVPKITKVVINMGLGEGTQNAKIVDTGAEELGKITGQKAKITIRDNNKVLAAQDVTLKEDGIEQIETILFNAGPAGVRTIHAPAGPRWHTRCCHSRVCPKQGFGQRDPVPAAALCLAGQNRTVRGEMRDGGG